MARSPSACTDRRFPLTVPVTVLREGEPIADEYGNMVRGPGREDTVLCFAVVVGGMDIPTGTTPDAVQYDLTVYAPCDAGITTRDRIRYRNEWYEVVAPPGVWDENPWWSPGLMQVLCKRWVRG